MTCCQFTTAALTYPYTVEAGRPVLTREGFHTILLRDTILDPVVQCRRFNAFLATHGARVIDPETGRPFPTLVVR
jgi:hypothetical protein